MSTSTDEEPGKQQPRPVPRHLKHLNAHEVAVLRDVCAFLERNPQTVTSSNAKDLLKLFYSIPHRERRTRASFSLRLTLLERGVGTLDCAEFAALDDPEGIEADAELIDVMLAKLQHIRERVCTLLRRGES